MRKGAETQKVCDIGIIGLGVMGQNLLLNIASKGFSAAGYDKDQTKVDRAVKATEGQEIFETVNLPQFILGLQTPRKILMMVPAGTPVDSVIHDLLPYLEKGDILIDAGNSYFKDTNGRLSQLAEKGVHLLGVGISGGEEGARNGPSIMPGGDLHAYAQVRHIFEEIAAKVDGEPCVAYLGPGSAGHFVKMVHNGIEYGLMQLISETYDLMKRGLRIKEELLHGIYKEWNEGDLNSYLIEITSHIFEKKDPKTAKLLIDVILDQAKQKGTGKWTSQSAMELQVPAFTIDTAVGMRYMSMLETERKLAAAKFARKDIPFEGKPEEFIQELASALHIGMILVFAQGMSVLSAASKNYQYCLDLATIARIWRGGCIIRSSLLDEIHAAYAGNNELENLLLAETFSEKVLKGQDSLRKVVIAGAKWGLPIPAFMSALGYLDAFRSDWLPANLIQAQRDFFGAHTYERIDEKGTFHTLWE